MTTKTTKPKTAGEFLANARKAIVAGIVGAAGAAGTSIPLVLQDGTWDPQDTWIVLGAIVGGFFVGAVSVYGTTNTPPSS